MKKLFTSLLLLVLGVVVADAQTIWIGGEELDYSTSKTYTSSDLTALKSGTIEWDASSKKLTLVNAKIESSHPCIGGEDLGTSNSERHYIYFSGSCTLKSTEAHGMRFDRSFLVIYGTDKASLDITSQGGEGYAGIDAEDCTLGIWSIKVLINSKGPGISGNPYQGKLTFIGTYASIRSDLGSVDGFKTLTLDDCLIYKGGDFNSGQGIVGYYGDLSNEVQIRPFLRVGEVSVRTEADAASGTNWNWDKSSKTLTVTGDITASGNNYAIANWGIQDLVIKWEGSPTVKNGSTYSGAAVLSQKNIKFAGNSTDPTKAMTIKGFISISMYSATDRTLTIDNATLNLEGARCGINGENITTNLVINNSTIKAKGVELGAIRKMKSCQMTGCGVNTALTPGVAWRQSLNGFGTVSELLKGENYLYIDVPTETYDIKVLGVEVSDINATDVQVDGLTEGKISFSTNNNTLSLKSITLAAPAANNNPAFEINAACTASLSGYNTVTSNGHCFDVSQPFTIQGSGNIEATSTSESGISVRSNGKVTLQSTNYMGFKGAKFGYWGSCFGDEVLTLKKTPSDDFGYVFEGAEGAVYNLNQLDMSQSGYEMDHSYDSFCTNGVYFDNGSVRGNDGKIYKGHVAFKSIKEFTGLRVAGKAINRVNDASYDIPVGSKYITAGGGEAAVYSPSTKTLTLTDITINTNDEAQGGAVAPNIENTKVNGLTIDIVGNCKLEKTPEWTNTVFDRSTTIQGSGKLTVDGDLRIFDYGYTLTLKDVNIEAKYLQGAPGTSESTGTLVVDLTTAGKTVSVSNYVDKWTALTLENGTKIVTPDGGYFDAAKRWVANADGTKAYGVVFGDKNATAIDAVKVASDAEVRQIFDASGRETSTAKRGLNIIRMSDGRRLKVMVK